MVLVAATIYVPLGQGLYLQAGVKAFTTTGSTVGIPTKLTGIVAALVSHEGTTTPTSVVDDMLYVNKSVSSGLVVVTRGGTNGTSALKVSYLLIGTTGPEPSSPGSTTS